MQNKKTLILLLMIIALGIGVYFLYSNHNITPVVINEPSTTSTSTSVIYKNTEYGFNFSLPNTWQGYTIVKDLWKGTVLKSTVAPSGPKLLIRNPKWTASAPYEDLPVLIFTISQWDAYLAESFSVSAAPIQASELGRNTTYVFALPPRWDFDYSLEYKEAEDIIARNPLHTFNLEAGKSNSKLNIDVVCEHEITSMSFQDAKSAAVFVADCKEGKHPEVIEKYKKDMNLGDGAVI